MTVHLVAFEVGFEVRHVGERFPAVKGVVHRVSHQARVKPCPFQGGVEAAAFSGKRCHTSSFPHPGTRHLTRWPVGRAAPPER
ncbi:hypothetical protein GCM10009582_30060 [Arthrobacter flavus]